MNQGDDERIDGYLARLPTALPDAGHVDTVVSLHLRRRRWRTRLPPALAAAAVLAWLTLGPVWKADPIAPEAVSPSSGWVELRSADRRLQAAYLVGANDERIARLWESRRDASLQIEDEHPVKRRVRL